MARIARINASAVAAPADGAATGWLRAPSPRFGRLPGLLLTSLVVVAAAVRLQDLMLVPRLTDETEEVLIGFRIYQGIAFPLVGADTYIGAMFNYLMAGVFWVAGPRPEAGRLFVLACGALGIVPTYLLGRALGGSGVRGQVVGSIAAALQAASATDILITSRLAYSNSLTPLFSTTGLWLLHGAIARRSGPMLAASGLAFGLALQTHLAAVVLWPGLGLYLLMKRRHIAWRWLLVAATLAVLAVWNLIAFNVLNAGATLGEVAYRSSDYGGAPSAGLDGWPSRLGVLVRVYAQALGGRVTEYIEPEAVFDPSVLLYAGLAISGLAILAIRREWIIILALLSGLLMISLLNGRLEPVVARSRHYAQLLPIGFVAVGVALDALRGWLGRRVGAWRASGTVAGQRVPALVVAVLTLTLVATSQWQLQAYVAERLSRPDKNNRALLQAVDAIVRERRLEDRVFLDALLASADVNSNRRGLRDAEYLLTVVGQEYELVDLTRRPLPASRPVNATRRAIFGEESTSLARQRYRLEPMPGDPGDGARYRAFRVSTGSTASP